MHKILPNEGCTRSIALRPLFGGGNTNFTKFLEEHACKGNEFCSFWKLPPPVDHGEERAADESNEHSDIQPLSISVHFPEPQNLLTKSKGKVGAEAAEAEVNDKVESDDVEEAGQKRDPRMSFTHINSV